MTFNADRTARLLKASGPTQVVVFHTLKVFYKVWHTDLLYKFRLYEVMERYFTLLSRFLVVKDFELFCSTSHLVSLPQLLEDLRIVFRYSWLWMNKRKSNKTVWETESLIYIWKSIKTTFYCFKFLNVGIISLQRPGTATES